MHAENRVFPLNPTSVRKYAVLSVKKQAPAGPSALAVSPKTYKKFNAVHAFPRNVRKKAYICKASVKKRTENFRPLRSRSKKHLIHLIPNTPVVL